MTRPIVHGKTSTYNNHKCRCDLCKKAHTDYAREWRIRTGRSKPAEPRTWHFVCTCKPT